MRIDIFNKKNKKNLEENYPLKKENKPFSWLYPAFLISFLVIGVVAIWKYRKRISFSAILSLMILTGIGGYFWTIAAQSNGDIPAWFFFPWVWSGIEPFEGLALIDILFFPLSTLMGVAVYYFWKISVETKLKDFNDPHAPLNIFYSLYVLSILVVVLFTNYFGIMNNIFFGVPGVCLLTAFLFLKDRHVKGFFLFVLTMAIFGFIWNFISVDMLPLIGQKTDHNLNSFSSWAYGIYTTNGFQHSTVYLDKNLYPQAWIFNSPVTMVVDMPFKGSVLIYLALETFGKHKELAYKAEIKK